jgi:hypothetical protein
VAPAGTLYTPLIHLPIRYSHTPFHTILPYIFLCATLIHSTHASSHTLSHMLLSCTPLMNSCSVRDIWAKNEFGEDKGDFELQYTALVPKHGVVMLRVAEGGRGVRRA